MVHLKTHSRSVVSILMLCMGTDGIPPRFIKIILPHIIFNINHFYYIFQSLKYARVIPIPKVNNQ